MKLINSKAEIYISRVKQKQKNLNLGELDSSEFHFLHMYTESKIGLGLFHQKWKGVQTNEPKTTFSVIMLLQVFLPFNDPTF